MSTTALVISIVLTIGVLLLSLLTISQGYGFKHTVDPPVKRDNEEEEQES